MGPVVSAGSSGDVSNCSVKITKYIGTENPDTSLLTSIPLTDLPVLFQSSGWSKDVLVDRITNSYGLCYEVLRTNTFSSEVRKSTFALEKKYTHIKGRLVISSETTLSATGQFEVFFEVDGVEIKKYQIDVESMGVDFDVDVSSYDRISVIVKSNVWVESSAYVGFANAEAILKTPIPKPTTSTASTPSLKGTENPDTSILTSIPLIDLPVLFQSSGWSKDVLVDRITNSYGLCYEVLRTNTFSSEVRKSTFALEKKYTHIKGRLVISSETTL
jgi:hypothetical protein